MYRLTLHQDNEKNMSTKENIVVSQECLKFLGQPVTCGSQRVKVLINLSAKTDFSLLCVEYISISLSSNHFLKELL